MRSSNARLSGAGVHSLLLFRLRSVLAEGGPALGTVAVLAYFAVTIPVFATSANILGVLQQTGPLVLISMGMALTMILRGVDLSVAQTADAAGLVSATLLVNGTPVVVALLAGVGVGLVIGAVNAVLVAAIGIPALIATLGTMFIVRAGELMYSNNGNPAALYNLPSSQTDFLLAIGQGQWGSLPVMVPAVGIVLLVMIAITARTNAGRYFVAIGLNARSTQFSGVNIRRYFALGFVFSGVLAALGGIALLAFTNSAVPRGDESMLFDAFVAVYVGASINPTNRITLWSTAIGAIFIGLLTNALILMKLGQAPRDILSGSLILLAVAAGRARRRD